MRFRVLVVLLLVAAGMAAQPVVRHYGTADGLSHQRIRDIVQDSAGYLWFATWTGVDRFDGYEFRNFRSFPSDSVKLDNNRIERLAPCPGGDMAVETYSGRRYRLDPRHGTFCIDDKCTDKAFGNRRPTYSLRAELADYPAESLQKYVDRDGNLWIARNGGIDYVTVANPAFTFIDSTPLDSIGADIHVVYAAPDNHIWAASRDTRIMVYDSDGHHIGNLTPSGRIIPDPSAPSGVRAYSFMAGSDGRMWIGTKSRQLLVLTPRGSLTYSVRRYLPSDAPDSLHCADIYDIAEGSGGNMWLATFGGGIVRASDTPDGLRFGHKEPAAPGRGLRIRRLQAVGGTLMMAAATDGMAVFDMADSLTQPVCFNSTEPSRGSSLSNDDVLDICLAADGTVYLSAFSGGIDFIPSGAPLLSDSIAFGHRNIRDGLCVDPVLSVTQGADSSMWVVSSFALARYDAGWHLLSVFDSTNLGRKVEFTEARPALLSDGRIVFGISGGLLIVDPARIGATTAPSLVISGIDSSSGSVWPDADGTIHLPRGCRDLALHFAALQYAGAEAVRYAWRADADTTWTELGHERTLRLSSLPAGTHTLHLRSTDPYGLWADNTIAVTVDVPRTLAEMSYTALIVLCSLALTVLAAMAAVRIARAAARRRLLGCCIDTALHGTPAPEGVAGRLAVTVGQHYTDSNLKVEPIAAELGMPRNELRHAVKQAIGISVEDFIRAVRVTAACALLDSGVLIVAETAYRCGFRTPQYMSMVFKEQTGLTPGEYLRKKRTSSRQKSCK